MERTAVLAVALGWLALACSSETVATREWTPEDHSHPDTVDPSRIPQAEPSDEAGGTARAARALFTVSCAGCHGRDGRGGGSALPPGIHAPDLSAASLQDARTDTQLAAVIRDGRGAMPGFADRVNPQGIAALVAHVRSLRAAAPPAADQPAAAAPSEPSPTGTDAP